MLGDLWQDLRYGARLLLRNPWLTLTVVLTLSLGIGANTSIFGVVNAVLLRPFPYIDENRLIAIESGDRTKGEQQMAGLSPGNFWELRQGSPSFDQIAGFMGPGFSFTDVSNPETVPGVMVSPALWSHWCTLIDSPDEGASFLCQRHRSDDISANRSAPHCCAVGLLLPGTTSGSRGAHGGAAV